jgi:hypothetical protein
MIISGDGRVNITEAYTEENDDNSTPSNTTP